MARLRLVLAALAAAAAWAQPTPPTPTASTLTVGDRWPEFEVPPIPEDKDGTQIRLSRIRDGYLAVNTRTDPAITAELLIGDALANKGFSPEQVFAVQQVVGLLVKTGVVELHAEKLAAASQSMAGGEGAATDAATAATAATTTAAAPVAAAAPALGKHRHLRSATVSHDGTVGVQRQTQPQAQHQQQHQQQEHRQTQGCCPCVETTMGHHPKPSSPHYSLGADKQQQPAAATAAAAQPPKLQTRREKASMYKTMKAVGLALRRAAAARAFYLYLTEDPKLEAHSFDEFGNLGAEEQEAMRKEVVGQLLLTCKRYGLSGAELQVRRRRGRTVAQGDQQQEQRCLILSLFPSLNPTYRSTPRWRAWRSPT